jgi:hypothetical protein
MRTLVTIVGVLAVLLGGYSLLGGEFSLTGRETVLEMGPLQATAETRDVYAVPPAAAGGLIVVGLAAMMFGARRSS